MAPILHQLFHFIALSFIITSAAISAVAQSSGGGSASGALWCVAKNNAEDAALQSALDWACGQGGADCSAIQQGGPCYDSSDILKTASFAFNDYFLKHGLSQDSCNFDNTAALTDINPSHGSCKFPSSKGAGTGNFTGSGAGGIGSSTADISGSNSLVERRWIWSLLIFHSVYAIMRFL